MSEQNDTDLIERIRTDLGRLPVRDLPSPVPAMGRGRRRRRAAFVRTGFLALLLAVAVIVPLVQLSGLRGQGPSPAPATRIPEPKANGDIWAEVGGGEGGTAIEHVDPVTGHSAILWTDDRWPSATGSPAGHVNQAAVGGGYSFSPDGSQVVFSGYGYDASGKVYGQELFVMNANGTNILQITHDLAVDGFPAWSPDGRSIVYASYRGSNFRGSNFVPGCLGLPDCPSDLYLIDANGGTPTQLTDDVVGETQPSWSPDGSRITFVTVRADGTGTLEVMNADGSGRTPITSGSGSFLSFPRWSPGAGLIAFLREDQGQTMHLWTVAPDGSAPHDLLDTQADSDFGPLVWSPDATQIAFAKLIAGKSQVWLTNLAGNDRQLATNPQYAISPIAWQPASPSSAA